MQSKNLKKHELLQQGLSLTTDPSQKNVHKQDQYKYESQKCHENGSHNEYVYFNNSENGDNKTTEIQMYW